MCSVEVRDNKAGVSEIGGPSQLVGTFIDQRRDSNSYRTPFRVNWWEPGPGMKQEKKRKEGG